jgi:hypothetical protein
VSCTKINDVTENGIQNNTEITFKVNTYSPVATRAIVSGTTIVDNFGVYGFVNQSTNVNDGTEGAYIMKNAEFASDGTSSTKYYWPKADNNDDISVSFTAYSPYASSGPNISGDYVVIPVTATAKTSSECADVLYASTTVNPQEAPVNLTFNHALSWIEFQARRDETSTVDVKITSIKFKNADGTDYSVLTSGNLNIKLTDGTTSWTGTSGSSINYAEDTPSSLSGTHSILSDALVLPQSVPAKITVTFDVTCAGADGDIVYHGRTITKTVNTGVDMHEGTANTYVSSWTSGHKYTYRFFVTANDIDFTVSIDDWTNENPFDVWDHDATAYVEHFFDKALIMQDQRMVGTMVLSSLMA